MTASTPIHDHDIDTSIDNCINTNINTNIDTNINTPLGYELDEDGHLCDYSVWTPALAQTLADTLAVTLTPLHLRILTQVREFHSEFKHPPATRPLIKYLIKTLPKDDISNQKLQRLFNTGLVARHVNRIAGLPKPPNCL